MSLEGSLQTVALPEVLHLLSDTSKTGELLVRGDRGEGRLWFAGGRLTGFSVGRTEQPADALFDLLRTGEGRFSFDSDAARPDDAREVGGDDGEEVRPVLEVAEARLAEWTDIVKVVPSLEHLVKLADEAPADGVSLDAAQWTLVVAIGEGRSVQEVLDRASLPEFEGCRSLKDLVDGSLATVSQPPKRARSRKSSAPKGAAVLEAVDEPVLSEEPQLDDQVEELIDVGVSEAHVAEDSQTPVDEEVTFENAPVEAHLDPGEYVFAAASPEPVEEPVEELAPWSVQLGDGASDAEDVFVPQHVPLPEPHDDQYDNGTEDARAALAALIAEIPADDQELSSHEEAPDGLADRGPWTSRELDQMSAWEHDEHQEAPAASGSLYDAEAPAAAQAATRFHSYQEPLATEEAYAEQFSSEADATDDGSEDEEEPESKPEPVNRGLLLKFLSSVRS